MLTLAFLILIIRHPLIDLDPFLLCDLYFSKVDKHPYVSSAAHTFPMAEFIIK